jgi:glycosyltransferase involved in cell wall biosynthesis
VRILLDYRPALRERTGVGEFVHELARALVRSASDDIAILTTSFQDRPSPHVVSELAGVDIIDHRIPVRGLTWAWNRLEWPPVEWLAGHADVVHAQTPLLIPSRRSAGVVTIHDLDFLAHPERAEAEMRRDFPALVRRHAQRADHVVVSSHYAAGQVASRLNLSRDRITVCSPGAPSWAAEVARARTLGTPGTVGCILFVGTLEPRKNIGTLLDGYERLRRRRADAPPLVLAGRARPSVSAELNRVNQPPLAGHVTALGYVTNSERQRLYRDARLLVLPSLEEGFGIPVLEAMACGVPVIVSNRGSLPEVAGSAAEPVNATDANALVAEMERLLDPTVAHQASVRGLARAAEYSWDRCAASARRAYAAAVEARTMKIRSRAHARGSS